MARLMPVAHHFSEQVIADQQAQFMVVITARIDADRGRERLGRPAAVAAGIC